jgi:putative oxidoreductase
MIDLNKANVARALVRGRDDKKTGSEGSVMINDINDELILVARPHHTISDFRLEEAEGLFGHGESNGQLGTPMPVLAAAVATFMELPVAFAVAIGAFVRPLALLLVLYTLGTALIGHRYWTKTGADRVDSMDGFYKNLSIMGGFLLLHITGAGQYSIDALFGIAAP